MVKSSLFVLFGCLLFASCTNQSANSVDFEITDTDSLALIPFPNSIEIDSGYFEINGETTIQTTINFKNEYNYLKNILSNNLNDSIEVLHELNLSNNSIQFIQLFNKGFHPEQDEYYKLVINKQRIMLSAYQPAGIMRGIQTLRQLFVNDFHKKVKRNSWYIPCLTIEDAPKFKHRGLLLDVCRHFFDKDVVLKYIDALAYYKMNVLHLHLTEDQGWRMPIDKYPLLNEIGSWRLDSNGNKYGGYYTKEELREIVAYAAERHITVIPEIELPGHAQASLAAYPQFSCTGGPIEVVNDWGVFKEIYCAGNDSTFDFIEDILTEVMEIFPSEYIHIGGDEAPKFRWEHCEKCQKRMKDEGLANEHELQSYFIQRIEHFLNAHDRKLIGWDEILEGGLSDNATVQSWRGFDGGKLAAESGHQAIMSPTSHCYLDYGLNSIDLKKIYNFDPIPTDINPDAIQFIIGGECNMWTEHVPNETNLDSKVFPRMIGLAEVLWSYPEERDFVNFYTRLQKHYPTLRAFGIEYGLETIGTYLKEVFTDSTIFITLEKNLPDLALKYYWFGRDNQELSYDSPIPFEEGELHVQAYKNEKKYGDPITQRYTKHLAMNTEVTYQSAYNESYPANGTKALVDGKIGSADFHDGNWQGFWNQDVDLIVDLGKQQTLKYVRFNFYQYANSWIFLPKKITIRSSEDGSNWKDFMVYTNEEIDLSNRKSHKTVVCSPKKEQTISNPRYLKIYIEGIDKIPAGHEAAGQDTWLFIDEIIVK